MTIRTFSDKTQRDYIAPMIVDAALASTLASTAVPIVICIAAGSAVGRGDSRWPDADMLVGFGLLGGALTVLAVATPFSCRGS